MLLLKHPAVIRDKWVRVVMNVRKKKERQATLRDIISFIKEETRMHDYIIRKTNKDHDNIQPRESRTDTVKCASVNGKLDTEVISMCIVAVWVGHESSKKNDKDICNVG